MWVLFNSFNLYHYIYTTNPNMCISRSMMKQHQKIGPDLLVVIGSACLLFPSLNTCMLPIVFTTVVSVKLLTLSTTIKVETPMTDNDPITDK